MRYDRYKLILILATVLVLPGCGGKKDIDDEPQAVPAAAPTTPSPFVTPPTPPDPPVPPGPGGEAPLSFSVSETGGSSTFQTTAITTDTILRVRYQVGPTGNVLFDSSDVRVEITVNGSTRIPRYSADSACPSGGCEYGRPSDGTSDVLDFSAQLQPGVDPVITITQARYNWYCAVYVLPYPSCYRLVQDPNASISFPGHYWRGTVTVQTNATDPTLF